MDKSGLGDGDKARRLEALARMFPAMSVRLIRAQFRAFQSPSTVRFARYRQIADAVLAGDPLHAGRRHATYAI